MTRSTSTTDRVPLAAPLLYAAWALIPALLLACSDAEETRTTSVGAETPAVETTAVAGAATGSPEADSTARSAIRANVSYEDAESVFQRGDYAEAQALFAAYVETRPENPWGYYMLGMSAWKAGDRVAAEAAFDSALSRDPKHVKSYLNSARVLLELDRAPEALERARLALELDSASADALRLQARARYQMGQVDSAIANYRQALVLDDEDVWAMNNLGLIYIEQGRSEEALRPLARAVQLRPTAPVFQNNLGIALERTGHLAAAQHAFESAVRADSTYAKALQSLARVAPLVDSTLADPLDLAGVAEEFRLMVKMWGEGGVEED